MDCDTPDTANERLQLSPDEMRALGHAVIDLLVDHMTTIDQVPAVRSAPRGALEKLLREPIPERGLDALAVLEQARRDVFGYSAELTHPRFFAFVPSPSNFVGVMADALAAGFNSFCGSWLVSSGPSEVELVTVDWLRQLCGMPDRAGGLFVSGGSMANLTGLAVARHVKLGDRTAGATVYFSDQTHSAVTRALKVLGLAAEQLRIVPSDESFRLRLDMLQDMIASDRAAGLRPFCVVANAGTTNSGAVDPLVQIVDFCRDHDLWLHVDGAYGAAAALVPEGRSLLEGMEAADSLALDPHKWLFQPFQIGCLLVRDSSLLPETFAVHPEILRDVDRGNDDVNFRDYGIELTRGFRALKLWMSLKVFGLSSFRAAIARGMQLARLAEQILRDSPAFELVTPAQLGIVTFRFVSPASTEHTLNTLNGAIIDATMADGFAAVTSTVLRGKTVLRLCTINPRTTEDDLRETIRRLEHYGHVASPICDNKRR